MARCEECVHFDVCYLSEIDNEIRESGENPNCLFFSPTADVVEVVRCKDCVCSEDDVVDEDMIWCKNYECCIHKNGYCFYGEGKE